MKALKDYFWPAVGLIAVVLSIWALVDQLRGISAGDVWASLKAVPPHRYVLAGLSTLVAYAALAWYDRIALVHLGRASKISWFYVSVCSFTTYAVSHNIGASVFSGALVRYRAYTAKGLTPPQVAVLVVLCSYTFVFGNVLLGGLVLLGEPQILSRLSGLSPWFAVSSTTARLFGVLMLGFCALYTLGSALRFPPLRIGTFELIYPRLGVVARQYLAAPLELCGAAGIVYFALPEAGNPGFFVVLGVFLLSFGAGLLVQAPGGVGVFELVFLTALSGMGKADVIAALLVWRLFYLLAPLAMSIPVIVLFERSQLGKVARARTNGLSVKEH